MKSIFSTQNLHTFFLRKYWRLPLGRPPGPPGPPPPGPPSRRGPPCPPPGPPWPPSRRGAPPGVDACFCSSAIFFTLSLIAPTESGTNFFISRPSRNHFLRRKKYFRRAATSLSPQLAPALVPAREPAWSGADAAPRASRASTKVFSAASNLRPDARSDT